MPFGIFKVIGCRGMSPNCAAEGGGNAFGQLLTPTATYNFSAKNLRGWNVKFPQKFVRSAIKFMFQIFNKNKKEPKNIKEVLECLKKLEEKYDNLSRELSAFKEKSKKDMQKVGMVRFNPFPEVGGDQSFSIALLDSNNDGFVITSHYLRELNRVYAKPIENGTSKYQLSKEEEDAINRAINS